jgi:hypothetical protein
MRLGSIGGQLLIFCSYSSKGFSIHNVQKLRTSAAK